jgi:hypothetical protein
MVLDNVQLSQLFTEVNSVLYRSGNHDLTVNLAMFFRGDDEAGTHRVQLMDALRSAVNGVDIVTADGDRQSQPWYSNTDEFVEVAAMAVAQFNRN